MKYRLLILVMTMLPLSASAQETQTDYNFLRLPISAHAAALGGDNITIIEDDPTLVFNNPALISSVSDNSLNLNFMSYMKGTKTASASFVKAIKERSTIAVSAEYMDYGNIPEVDENNVQSGTFSAKDIAIGGYLLLCIDKHYCRRRDSKDDQFEYCRL
jgi:long-subunit fatty acid transport protein